MRKSIALLMLAALLPACGQKGPLYLPKPTAGLPTAPLPSSGARADDKKNPAPAEIKSP